MDVSEALETGVPRARNYPLGRTKGQGSIVIHA